MNFFRKGLEYHKLAQAFNGVFVMINEIEAKLNNPYFEPSNAVNDLSFIAFISRKEIIDRLDEFNWDMLSPIYIPNISNGKVTLTFAFQQTLGRLAILADRIGYTDIIDEILNRGKRFYELEMSIPDELREKLF